MNIEHWRYHNPVSIICGSGELEYIADYLPYSRLALVTTAGFVRRGVVARIEQLLGNRLVTVLDSVQPNPDLSDIDHQAGLLKDSQPDAILALGGGSSMDTAKALARLLGQPAGMTLAAHFRDGAPFTAAPALPVAAVPTTAGTGAEVTAFGTVWDFKQGKKYSVTGDDLYPVRAILDPNLTFELPEEVTISSGLDAVSHALESTWNKNASPVTLSLAAKSLQISLSALPELKTRPDNPQARGAMMQASLLAGMAISQTRTALAHSISYPLTSRYNLPHGIACSFSLPALMLYNAQADDGRLLHLARALGFADVDAFAVGLRSMFHQLGVASLFRRYIPTDEAVLALADRMFAPGRAENNLRAAAAEGVIDVLKNALEQLSSDYA